MSSIVHDLDVTRKYTLAIPCLLPNTSQIERR